MLKYLTFMRCGQRKVFEPIQIQIHTEMQNAHFWLRITIEKKGEHINAWKQPIVCRMEAVTSNEKEEQ